MLEEEGRLSAYTETAWEFLQGHQRELRINNCFGDILCAYELLKKTQPILIEGIEKKVLKEVNGSGAGDFRSEFSEAIHIIAQGYSMNDYNERYGTSLSPKRID